MFNEFRMCASGFFALPDTFVEYGLKGFEEGQGYWDGEGSE